MDMATSRQRGELSQVPGLLQLLPSPLASPVCAGAQRSRVMMPGSGCPWEPFAWGSQMPRPHGDCHALSRCQRGQKMEHQLSVHQQDWELPVTGGTSQPLPLSPCPGQTLARQGRLRQHRLEHSPAWGGKAAVLCSA